MASKKHGTKPREWAKHLRKEGKRVDAKLVRRAGQKEARSGKP